MTSVGQYRIGLESPASAPDHDAGEKHGGRKEDDLQVEQGSFLQGIWGKRSKRGIPWDDRQNIPFFRQPCGRVEKKVAVAGKIHKGIGRERGIADDHNRRPRLAFFRWELWRDGRGHRQGAFDVFLFIEVDYAAFQAGFCPAVRRRSRERHIVPCAADLFIEGDMSCEGKQHGGGEVLRNFMLGKRADKQGRQIALS